MASISIDLDTEYQRYTVTLEAPVSTHWEPGALTVAALHGLVDQAAKKIHAAIDAGVAQ
jgi:hypothetical protein